MKLAILGAGAGGAAATVELTLAGHDVALWNRSSATLEPFHNGIAYEGVLGVGLAKPRTLTTDLATALQGAALAVVTLPTTSHASMATALTSIGWRGPVLLNPGHTGGALEFARATGAKPPPLAEFSTLTHIARKLQPGLVTITGQSRQLRLAHLPGGSAAADLAQTLWPAALRMPNVLATGLANINMVLHAPGAVLAAAWVEATAGDFTFYVQGMTRGVARVMTLLDAERLAVATAYGISLPNVVAEMQAIGSLAADIPSTPLDAAIASGAANRRIRAPDTLAHRYYREDFGHGVLPFLALAAIANVDVPVASALFALAEAMIGPDLRTHGRTAAAMGIAGLTRAALLNQITEPP